MGYFCPCNWYCWHKHLRYLFLASSVAQIKMMNGLKSAVKLVSPRPSTPSSDELSQSACVVHSSDSRRLEICSSLSGPLHLVCLEGFCVVL